MYPRYVMEKLVRTWLNRDKQWFDKKAVFEILKGDIVTMLDSKYPSKENSDLRKNNTRSFHLNYFIWVPDLSERFCTSRVGMLSTSLATLTFETHSTSSPPYNPLFKISLPTMLLSLKQ